MNVYHVIEGVDNPNAGPSYSVPSLLQQLNKYEDTFASLITPNPFKNEWRYDVDVVKISSSNYINPIPINKSSKLVRTMLKGENIIHGHGVWRASNLFYLLKRKTDLSKLLCSPRGMLTEWAMSHRRFRKAPFWKYMQKPALKKVDCFHVTAESELEDIRRLGFKQPAVIIPNGVDMPELNSNFRKRNNILFLSRLNKKKGLDLLLSAWKELYEKYPKWSLIIAGPQYENYAKYIIELSKKLDLKNIYFVGEVFGDSKEELFQSSSIFVLPSYSENFGIVVAEALSHAVPVITTSGTPWGKVTEKKCGWYIDPEVNLLKNSLEQAMRIEQNEREQMGLRGRKWMEQSYGWESIAYKMHSTYHWLLNPDLSKPKDVVND